MTREEAIRYFKRHIDLYCVEGICREAEEMAIEALEQEPCDDAISRQAVHIELEKWITYGEYKYSNAMKYLYDRIDRLSSVNPQPKAGHWIRHEKREFSSEARECSICKCWFNWDMPRNSFCPNCGARMVEPTESEG